MVCEADRQVLGGISMSYKDPTYVIFDGDNDKWAYAYMLGWKANDKIDFDFRDAHDLDHMTSRAQNEAYVKAQLKERMKKSTSVVVIIGQNTKNLYKFVRWELELALDLGLPIIAVNLNGLRLQDDGRCPPIIRNKCVIHISFHKNMIKYALDEYCPWYRNNATQADKDGSWRYYNDSYYKQLGIKD